jgi:hypothetical protein
VKLIFLSKTRRYPLLMSRILACDCVFLLASISWLKYIGCSASTEFIPFFNSGAEYITNHVTVQWDGIASPATINMFTGI